MFGANVSKDLDAFETSLNNSLIDEFSINDIEIYKSDEIDNWYKCYVNTEHNFSEEQEKNYLNQILQALEKYMDKKRVGYKKEYKSIFRVLERINNGLDLVGSLQDIHTVVSSIQKGANI